MRPSTLIASLLVLAATATLTFAQQPAAPAAERPAIKIAPKVDTGKAGAANASAAAPKVINEQPVRADAAPAPKAAAASEPAAKAPAAPKPATADARMEKLADHFVEGPGYITFFHQQTKGYGGTYEECERNCLADNKCVMIEFYKPLRKCHLYNHTRWSGKSRDANVALKKPAKAAAADAAIKGK